MSKTEVNIRVSKSDEVAIVPGLNTDESRVQLARWSVSLGINLVWKEQKQTLYGSV